MLRSAGKIFQAQIRKGQWQEDKDVEILQVIFANDGGMDGGDATATYNKILFFPLLERNSTL